MFFEYKKTNLEYDKSSTCMFKCFYFVCMLLAFSAAYSVPGDSDDDGIPDEIEAPIGEMPMDYEQQTSTQLSFALGANYRFPWHMFVRAEVDFYDRDAIHAMLRVGKYFYSRGMHAHVPLKNNTYKIFT